MLSDGGAGVVTGGAVGRGVATGAGGAVNVGVAAGAGVLVGVARGATTRAERRGGGGGLRGSRSVGSWAVLDKASVTLPTGADGVGVGVAATGRLLAPAGVRASPSDPVTACRPTGSAKASAASTSARGSLRPRDI